jgi:hypothetical protein
MYYCICTGHSGAFSYEVDAVKHSGIFTGDASLFLCISKCVCVDRTVQIELCQEEKGHTKLMCGVIE